MHPAAALLVPLALTQAVLCSFFSVNFSQVRQCGSFQVNFTGVPGSAPPALPVTLTIVPFSSNPILIPIPINTWDNTTFMGAAEITFLPFYAGKQFVASLDDANGQGMGLVSDVIGVQESSDLSCLPVKQSNNNHGGGNKEAKTDFYDLKGDFAQCATFNVTFNPTQIAHAPTVRAFLPRSFSFPINTTLSPPLPGNQEYILDIFHGNQAVLLLDDHEGHRETSGLFTSGGDIGSSTHCFPFSVPNQTAQVGAADTSSQPETMSQDAKIIVAVTCVAVVIIVAVVMAIFIHRKRNRTRLSRSQSSSSKSFVFTEDVDMGSTFIGRIRGRLSQFLGSNFSASGEKRSQRTYLDDEKSEVPYSYEGSYGIPTSPRGSLVHPHSRPVSDSKSLGPSWMDVERMLDEGYYRKASLFFVASAASPSNDSTAFDRDSRMPAPPFPLPVIDPPPVVHTRDSAPDAPLPAVPRSPSSGYHRYGPSSATNRLPSSWSDRQRRESGSSFGNLEARALSTNDRYSESSFGNRLSGRGHYSYARTIASSLRSSQFAFPSDQSPGERVNAARTSPFPTTPIGSRRTSRTSR